MRTLPDLFENNRRWAQRRLDQDPTFFSRLAGQQAPDYLWIGCADSRVPANEIVGLDPGELFVHRNVANVVSPDDPNGLSVVQYSVDVLKVNHIIVCGHFGCGGVAAAMGDPAPQPLEGWISPIREAFAAHESELQDLTQDERWRRLCELNVGCQVDTLAGLGIVRDAWKRRQSLTIHGWIYDVKDGLLRDLEVDREGSERAVTKEMRR